MMTDGTRRTKSGRIKLMPAMTGWMIEYVGDSEEFDDGYWSRDTHGWTARSKADVFTDHEKMVTPLPDGGQWVTAREVHERRVDSMRNHPASAVSRSHLIPLDGGGGASE